MSETTMADLTTPYDGLLPPLSTAVAEALRADIEANGVLVPIDVAEDETILDGHHRHRFAVEYQRDMGNGNLIFMKEISAPIMVNGRHWGALRTGYLTE